MKRFALAVAVLVLVLVAAAAGGPVVVVEAPKLPQEVLVCVEFASPAALDEGVKQFVGVVSPGTDAPDPAKGAAVKIAGLQDEQLLDPQAPVRILVFAPVKAESVVATLAVKDGAKYLENLRNSGKTEQSTEKNVTVFKSERQKFDQEAYQKATPEEKRNFQAFMKTVEEPFVVGLAGNQVVVGKSKELVQRVLGWVEAGTLPKDRLISGEGQVAAVVRAAAMVSAPDNPIAKAREEMTKKLQGAPAMGMDMGAVLKAELEMVEKMARELEVVGVSVRINAEGVRISSSCVAVKGGALEKYLAGVPAGAPAKLNYLNADAAVAMAARIGDLSPVMDWYGEFMRVLGPSMGQDPAKTDEMVKAAKEYVGLMGGDVAIACALGAPIRLVEVFAVKNTTAARDLLEKNSKLTAGMEMPGPMGKMKLETKYTRDVGTHRGAPIDKLEIEYKQEAGGLPPGMPPMPMPMPNMAQVMNSFAGPSHITFAGNDVVLALGPDSLNQLRQTVDGQFTRLDASPEFKALMAVLPENPLCIAYASLPTLANGLVDMLGQILPGMIPPPVRQVRFQRGPGLAGVAVREGARLHADVWVPAAEIKSLVDGAKAIQGAMMGGAAPGAPPAMPVPAAPPPPAM